jgi:hypothetical protein
MDWRESFGAKGRLRSGRIREGGRRRERGREEVGDGRVGRRKGEVMRMG